ncbi:MAG: protein-L-isoaspartate(D-aspartate) O-methyltransferase [Gammaproteobacteria bacterium]
MLTRRLRYSGVGLLWLASVSCSLAEPDWEARRMAMADEVATMAREVGTYTGRPTLDARVMQALADVPRHEFVPPQARSHAYQNRPLPIGADQTISQPFIVAFMTDLLALEPRDRVLEIGTGSGYQAAILAELVDTVYSIEIIASLGEQAKSVLQSLGYGNIQLRIGDGYQGWPEQAPFDAIIVTAAPEQVPPALLEQLAVGGRMVIPVGPQQAHQELMLLTRGSDGEIEQRNVLAVGFVPMTGGED